MSERDQMGGFKEKFNSIFGRIIKSPNAEIYTHFGRSDAPDLFTPREKQASGEEESIRPSINNTYKAWEDIRLPGDEAEDRVLKIEHLSGLHDDPKQDRRVLIIDFTK